MRLPRFPDPEELPSAVQVRTFSGDLKTVFRPSPVQREKQFKAFAWVVLVLFVIALGTSGTYRNAPFGMPELAPVSRWFYAHIPACDGTVDCSVQSGLVLLTIFAGVKLGFWVFWQLALMRYAAAIEDEMQ